MSVWNLAFFNQSEITPFAILNEYCEELFEETKGKLAAKVVLCPQRDSNSFTYEVNVTLSNFRYKVFLIAHEVSLYPVWLTTRDDIAKELHLPSAVEKCENEKEFRELVERILGSNTVGTVLSRLLQIADDR